MQDCMHITQFSRQCEDVPDIKLLGTNFINPSGSTEATSCGGSTAEPKSDRKSRRNMSWPTSTLPTLCAMLTIFSHNYNQQNGYRRKCKKRINLLVMSTQNNVKQQAVRSRL